MAPTLIVEKNDDQRRFDRVLRKLLPTLPLSHIYRLIRTGVIKCNGQRAAPHRHLKTGDRLDISNSIAAPLSIAAEWRPTNGTDISVPEFNTRYGIIVYRNQHIIGLHKWRGTQLFGYDSCQQEIRRYLYATHTMRSENNHQENPPWGLSFRPAALHRLDRNTSGLILFAISLHGARSGGELMSTQQLEKGYVALLSGQLTSSERWHDMIARDSIRKYSRIQPLQQTDSAQSLPEAITCVEPLLSTAQATLVFCQITGGRTHQIRAQAAAHGHPLVGDVKYHGGKGSYFLHAWYIRPRTTRARELMPTIVAPPRHLELSILQRLAPSLPSTTLRALLHKQLAALQN